MHCKGEARKMSDQGHRVSLCKFPSLSMCYACSGLMLHAHQHSILAKRKLPIGGPNKIATSLADGKAGENSLFWGGNSHSRYITLRYIPEVAQNSNCLRDTKIRKHFPAAKHIEQQLNKTSNVATQGLQGCYALKCWLFVLRLAATLQGLRLLDGRLTYE